MAQDSRFIAPRSLSRSLAELARRAGGERAREAELRAVLPSVLGSWLHRRVADLRLDGPACTLQMATAESASEVEALSGEIVAELRRRMGAAAPSRLAAEATPRGRSPEEHRTRRPELQASERPLTARALAEIEDEALRTRLARWAGLRLDE